MEFGNSGELFLPSSFHGSKEESQSPLYPASRSSTDPLALLLLSFPLGVEGTVPLVKTVVEYNHSTPLSHYVNLAGYKD